MHPYKRSGSAKHKYEGAKPSSRSNPSTSRRGAALVEDDDLSVPYQRSKSLNSFDSGGFSDTEKDEEGGVTKVPSPYVRGRTYPPPGIAPSSFGNRMKMFGVKLVRGLDSVKNAARKRDQFTVVGDDGGTSMDNKGGMSSFRSVAYSDANTVVDYYQTPRKTGLDWWFPAKAAFGRKTPLEIDELFANMSKDLRRQDTQDSIEIGLQRDSVDLRRVQGESEWIDRGRGFFQRQRFKNKQVALIQTGRSAGKSLVKLAGINNMQWHKFRYDPFSSIISMNFMTLILASCLLYLVSWMLFAVLWYTASIQRADCLVNVFTFWDAMVMSVSTANTIGYGIRAIRAPIDDASCTYTIVILSLQRLLMIIMDALLIGILFSKLSQPKKRSRTIFLSDSAVVCHRDGVLKLMFRIGDARQTTIIRPKVEAFLYTFNPSRQRRTSEGEYIPNKNASLRLEQMDESLLLPIIVSHVIDETSPLFGLTRDEMEALRAEIVVTFVAVNSETGTEFAARQSYLPAEIFWGFQFVKIIRTISEHGKRFHAVDLSRFHDIEPQALWGNVMMTQQEISRVLMNSVGNIISVPVPALGDKTLVISARSVLEMEGDKLKFIFRVGDVFPPCGQFLHAEVFAYFYPWRFTGNVESKQVEYMGQELKLGTHAQPNNNNLFLRVPVLVEHVIDERSPLKAWHTKEGFLGDSGAEVVVIVYGVNQVNQTTEKVQRIYKISEGDVVCGHTFMEIVSPPSQSLDGKPKIDYDKFHEVVKAVPREDEAKSWIYSHTPFMRIRRVEDNKSNVMSMSSNFVDDMEGVTQDLETSKYVKETLQQDFALIKDIFPDLNTEITVSANTSLTTTDPSLEKIDEENPEVKE